MPKFFILLLLAFVAHAQEQKRVAILNTEDDNAPPLEYTDLLYLTEKLREIALKVLPENKYFVMTTQSIIDKMGSKENAKKVCKEAQCVAEIGRKISVDYIGQARLRRFGGNLAISMELYHSARGNLIGSFTGESKDVSDLLVVLNKEAPQMFGKMPGAFGGSKVHSTSVEGGISGMQKTAAYEVDEEKRYLVNLSTEPSGAILSFDGEPSASCAKTPCKAELREGNVRIKAALDQYETADTTVLVSRNNQNIVIKLKPNFGVLEIKPAYLDGIGQNTQWSLSINGKPYSLGEINLSQNKYSVKLSHECYENVAFDAGINKGKREIFDMANNITLKKGGLILSAEMNGEPASEPVFVNGKQVGETPFSGSIPLCAKIEIGKNKEAVDVKLKYNEKIKHTHKSRLPQNDGECKVQSSVAIINTVDDSESPIEYVQLNSLTDKIKLTASNVLPSKCYTIMTTQSIIDQLGSKENAVKIVKEASTLAGLGRKISADYVAQARIGRFDKNLTINLELYDSKSGLLIGVISGSSKDISGLFSIINEQASIFFKKLYQPQSGGDCKGQTQNSMAILKTVDNGDPEIEITELSYLTDRIKLAASNVLSNRCYAIMTVESIIDKLGSMENAKKVSKEAQNVAEIGRKISANYIVQVRLGRLRGNLTINMELYNSKSGVLIGSFSGSSKDVSGLLSIIDKQAPILFKKLYSTNAKN
ncbi:MAG: PEGA domain-containing protein [Fibromonadaceae bacterium]|jgi:TolB-like protein|nr:PEGA domain-containing protein [Fibromonadaceae bacterium]